jgi:hypothetical protein
MNTQIQYASDLLNFVVEKLDIPKSLYEKAAARHRSLGEWLCRDSSLVKDFNPDIRPQGSFRFGTVNRPLDENEEYDLDNVCLLQDLSKSKLTQRQLKELYGKEIKAYADAKGILKPIEECKRCWRLHYADEVNFHLDTLPCVPEEQHVINRIVRLGVDADLARRCIAITDQRHPEYDAITQNWLSSNPRGFAAWFESRCKLGRTRMALNEGVRASVEDVPPYEWKTTLQRSVQVLKRHRDVMFKNHSEFAPISMIITNLAGHAYNGEADLFEAIKHIVARMPDFVRSTAPYVPNPADYAEDYADKWKTDARYEENFWKWHSAVSADINRIPDWIRGRELSQNTVKAFEISVPNSMIPKPKIQAAAQKAPSIIIPSASKPWG